MAKPNSNGTGTKMSGFISGLLNEGMSAVNEMLSKTGGNGSSGGTNSADMTPDSFRAMIATGPKNESIRQQIALWESLVTAVAGFDDQILALQNKKATMDKQRAEVQYQIHKAMYDLQQERLAAEAAQEQQSQQGPQQMWQRGGYPGQGMPQQAWGPQGYPGQAPQQYQGYPGQQAQAWGPGPQGYPGQQGYQGYQDSQGQGYPDPQSQGYPDPQSQGYPSQAPRGQMPPQQEWNQPQGQPQGYQQQSAPGWQINEAPAPTQPLPGFSSLNSQEYADAHQFGDYMGPTAREAVSKGNPHGGAPDLPSIDPATVIQGASFDDLPPLEEPAGGYVQYGTADDISAEDMLDDESDLPVGGVLN